jgi:16S rRNA (uracil1498-N3)-methyltransferase
VLFLYHNEAGLPTLSIDGDAYRYLFKVRRHRTGDVVTLRNLRDDFRYDYRIDTVDRRRALLTLVQSTQERRSAKKILHIGWCVVDPKAIEKHLPSLNEMGVSAVTFIYCERSQKNFKLDFRRLEKILINSSQQCGRTELMRLDTAENMEAFIRKHPDAWLLDFSDVPLPGIEKDASVTLVVGCEGGITENERALFAPQNIFGFKTELVLRSESAACAAAAKLLL